MCVSDYQEQAGSRRSMHMLSRSRAATLARMQEVAHVTATGDMRR
jgi:hypothetical protein